MVADAFQLDGWKCTISARMFQLGDRSACGGIQTRLVGLSVCLASSLTDALTGVGNRRRLEQALAGEVSRAERSGTKMCAFMADLDHFKHVNEAFGHEAGDAVLAAFGDKLHRLTRAADIVTRFGGEAFVVIMPDTDIENAVTVAERIREAVAIHRFEPLPRPVTASFGVVALTPGERAGKRAASSCRRGALPSQIWRNQVVRG